MTLKAQVLLQAGHKGRTSGATGASGPLGNEIDWTPIVVDEAVRILRNAGISVIPVKADDKDDTYGAEVELAVAIHFDGSGTPCASGTSIGYPAGNPIGSNKPAADEWRSLWKPIFPFKWMPDNFTKALRYYGDYKDWKTSDAEMVIELGEISCREQAEWLQPRLKYIGALVAHFCSNRVGGKVPHPGVYLAPNPIIESDYVTKKEFNDLLDTVKALSSGLTGHSHPPEKLPAHNHTFTIKGETE